jgi:D-glycero-alpha-D-manno-heptose 1-phosphate guanylyltransferase
MQAIILAGGFGTRLQSVVKDLPKPMAPIQGKPFLAYLIEYLKSQGITQVVLSVHYLREQIQDYFKAYYQGIDIAYAVEEQPLGTGGAIINALKEIHSSEPVFVLNGDTFLKLDYRAMYAQHQQLSPPITMALRKIANCNRYGVVLTEGNLVTAFNEQGGPHPGLINAGVYLIKPALFQEFPIDAQAFSFEKDFLFPHIAQLKPQAFIVEDYFIDIGIPEDYARANVEFPALIK